MFCKIPRMELISRSKPNAGFLSGLLSAAVGLMSMLPAASAHDVLLSYARIWAEPDAYVLEVNLDPILTESFLADKLDNPANWLDHNNFGQSRTILSEEAKSFFAVTLDGKACEPIDADFRVEQDNCIYTICYPRMGSGQLTLTHGFLDRMREGYKTVLDVLGPDGSVKKTVVFTAGVPRITVSLPGAVPLAVTATNTGADKEGDVTAEPQSEPVPARSWFPVPFFKLGVEHIAFGFDHLLFLGGLLVACRRPSDIFAIVTSFTLAHSITLSVAALDLWAPPSVIVEPAIAASIVFVGVENMLRSNIGKGRAWLTFAFGLIHGFGFASVLREIGLGQNGSSIVGPLFAFNVGIEAGQLSIVTLVFPGLLWLQHASSRARRWLKPSLSSIIALIGLYWFLQRTVFAV